MPNVKTRTTKKAIKTKTVVKPATKKGDTDMTAEEKEQAQKAESIQLDNRIKNWLWSTKNNNLRYQIESEEKKGSKADQEKIKKLKNFMIKSETVDAWYEELNGSALAALHRAYNIYDKAYTSIYKFRRDLKDTHISMRSSKFQDQLDEMQKQNEEYKARQDELLQEVKMLRALFKDLKSDQEETKESE